MKPIGHYWVGAVHAKFAGPSDWRRWADIRIEDYDSPPYWIIALSLATSTEEFQSAVAEQLDAETREAGRTIYYSDASLGYIYWRFKIGRVSFSQFLAEAGYDADCGYSDMDCESVYEILNELESRL